MEGRGLKFLRDSYISYRTELQSYTATQTQYRATVLQSSILLQNKPTLMPGPGWVAMELISIVHRSRLFVSIKSIGLYHPRRHNLSMIKNIIF